MENGKTAFKILIGTSTVNKPLRKSRMFYVEKEYFLQEIGTTTGIWIDSRHLSEQLLLECSYEFDIEPPHPCCPRSLGWQPKNV